MLGTDEAVGLIGRLVEIDRRIARTHPLNPCLRFGQSDRPRTAPAWAAVVNRVTPAFGDTPIKMLCADGQVTNCAAPV